MPKRLSKSSKQARPRRPKDVNQLAYQLVKESTQEESHTLRLAEIRRVMSEMGRKGGKISGARRKDNFSPQKRSEIALTAARARWAKRPAKASANKEP